LWLRSTRAWPCCSGKRFRSRPESGAGQNRRPCHLEAKCPADPLTSRCQRKDRLHMTTTMPKTVGLSLARHYGGVEAPQSSPECCQSPRGPWNWRLDGTPCARLDQRPSTDSGGMPSHPGGHELAFPCPKAEQAQGLSRPRSCEPDLPFLRTARWFWSLRSAKEPQP